MVLSFNIVEKRGREYYIMSLLKFLGVFLGVSFLTKPDFSDVITQ